MMKKILLPVLLQLGMLTSFAQVKIHQLLTENLSNPIVLDVQQPRFSWQLASEQRNVSQTAYDLKVSTDKGQVWSSGKVSSNQSVQVLYAGAAL